MDKPTIIAFYLPQYYPTKENNEWFGEGFTEWTNVKKARPLFIGHYQPKVPTELGYYDLRNDEIRRKQAKLAQEAGVDAFCYYHYWFGNGKQMLEKPLEMLMKDNEIDLPFCLCWANHTWYKKTWNSKRNELDKKPLLKIDYGDETDWRIHFYSLLNAFKDRRYYRVDEKLVFVLYRTEDIPNVVAFKEYWNMLAKKEGVGEFCFMSYVDDPAKMDEVKKEDLYIVSCKADIESIGWHKYGRKLSRFLRSLLSQILKRPLNVYEYKDIRTKLSSPLFKYENVFPVLLPNFDNTPRREEGALILHDATPEQFYMHCKEVFAYLETKQNKIVFLKSWNEWGEGNYMEPCERYGRGYIDALRRAKEEL